MQNPDEDTEWNAVLRSKGILPPKQKEVEINEDSVVEASISQKRCHHTDHTPLL